jgi:phosphoribosylanthranilate isomerase
MQVKVCGITSAVQLEQLVAMGADYAGCIFYAPSPRYAGNRLQPEEVRKVAGNICLTGVFVNETLEKIQAAIDAYGLKAVQLHGDEPPELCASLQLQVKVIKAISISNTTAQLQQLLDAYTGVADMFLFDTATASHGGSGKKFDWAALDQLDIRLPYLLSGGISPADLTAVNAFVASHKLQNFAGIDINSRFETAPGIKDMVAIQQFIHQLI